MRVLSLIVLVILGIIGAIVLREILFSCFVPDICAYHNGKEPGFFIRNFYDLPSWNGYHPAPNILNQIITFLIGGLIGVVFYLSTKKVITHGL